jgi:hypothetical protein
MTTGPPTINLRHDVWHLEPGKIVITNHATTTASGHTLRTTKVLLPRDQRHRIISDLMLLKFSQIERICGSDFGVFRVDMVTVRCNRFRIDRNDHIFMIIAAWATRVGALVTPRVDAGKGNINAWGNERIPVDNGGIGAISRRRGRDGASILQTETSTGGHRPVEEGCCIREIMTIIACIRISIVSRCRRTAFRSDWTVAVSRYFSCDRGLIGVRKTGVGLPDGNAILGI